MTKEYLLSKTLYGVDIIQNLIRKEFSDYIMNIKGDDCGENPDPAYADGRIIQITVWTRPTGKAGGFRNAKPDTTTSTKLSLTVMP